MYFYVYHYILGADVAGVLPLACGCTRQVFELLVPCVQAFVVPILEVEGCWHHQFPNFFVRFKFGQHVFSNNIQASKQAGGRRPGDMSAEFCQKWGSPFEDPILSCASP